MKVIIHAEADDLILAARAAVRSAAVPFRYRGCQYGEGSALREFNTERTDAGTIIVRQVPNPVAWPE